MLTAPCPYHENTDKAITKLADKVGQLYQWRAEDKERDTTLFKAFDKLSKSYDSISECLVTIKVNLPTSYITKTDLKEQMNEYETHLRGLCDRVDAIEANMDTHKGKEIGRDRLRDGFLKWGGWILGLLSLGFAVARFLSS